MKKDSDAGVSYDNQGFQGEFARNESQTKIITVFRITDDNNVIPQFNNGQVAVLVEGIATMGRL